MESFPGKILSSVSIALLFTLFPTANLAAQDAPAADTDLASDTLMESDTISTVSAHDAAAEVEGAGAAGHMEPATGHGEGGYDHHTALAIGERLFYGLAGSSDNPVNCAACHNLREQDTLNWSPSALDIALVSKGMDDASFANSLLRPVGKRRSVAHAGIELTDEEIMLIRGFLTEVEHTGLAPKKLDISRMLFFLFLVILVLLAVADLIWFKAIKFRMITVTILLLALGWGTKMVVQEAIALGRSKNYAPQQPIKFSHVIHAGEDQIDCQYCHSTAEYSKSAGIPSANVCLNCHTLIRDATRSGQFEINKIHAAVDNGEPIEWVRVHRLPDFVFFSHAQHVGVGGLECADCHGPVEEMDVLRQQNDLSMGWCLKCHRSHSVKFDESEYYKMTFKEFHKQLDQQLVDSILVEDIGGTDCMKCHY